MIPVAPPPADVEYTGQLRRADVPPLVTAVTASLGAAAFVLVPTLVTYVVYLLGFVLRGRPGTLTVYLGDATAFRLPEGMLGAHLGLASLIPLTYLLLRWGGGLAARWVGSVQPGLRWRYLLACLVAALVIMAVAVWFLQVRGHGPARPQHDYGWFLAVIVLTTPFQAAAEEYFFRGFLLQVLGRLSGNHWVPILVSALLFALVHGTQELPLFVDRFAFGVLAGWLVVRTGGLEAAVAAHVANNLLAFAAAGLWGTIEQARTLTRLSWGQAGLDVAVFAVVALAAWLLGRVMTVATRTPRDAAAGLR